LDVAFEKEQAKSQLVEVVLDATWAVEAREGAFEEKGSRDTAAE